MKNLHFLTVIMLITLVSLSCKTSYVSLEVLKPAEITIPQEVQKIALLNRTTPSKKDKAKNILEGIITGELPFVDRHAAEECIKGVSVRLQSSPRYNSVIPVNLDIKGSGTRQFPEPIPWEDVDNICKNYNVDALAVLEVFDSNNNYQNSTREATKKDGDKEIKYTEFVANLNVDVFVGWRIYMPSRKQIFDQNIFTDGRSWSATGETSRKAQAGLPSIDKAVYDAGYYAGYAYAERISPLWMRVSRMYYKKGNTDFEIAARRAVVKDWKGAADLWRKYVQSSNIKIAGYATYNMALACEMDGNLEAALDWAKKSYVDFSNKNAKYYIRTLEQRIYEQNKLKEQMGE